MWIGPLPATTHVNDKGEEKQNMLVQATAGHTILSWNTVPSMHTFRSIGANSPRRSRGWLGLAPGGTLLLILAIQDQYRQANYPCPELDIVSPSTCHESPPAWLVIRSQKIKIKIKKFKFMGKSKQPGHRRAQTKSREGAKVGLRAEKSRSMLGSESRMWFRL